MIYDALLSYDARDEHLVEELARLLRAEGLNLLLDKWHLLPGEPWQEALEKALHRSRSIVVCIGPSGLGPWQNEELWAALDTRLRDMRPRVIPVLLSRAWPSEVPPSMQRFRWLGGGPYAHLEFRGLLISINNLIYDNRDASDGETGSIPKLGSKEPARPPKFRLPRLSFRPRLKEVWLATAAPPQVARNSKFVARFSAYTQEYRRQVAKAVLAESPAAKLHLDLHTCQWEPGTNVTVTLSADPLRVEESSQSFVWNGKWVVLRFDVSVPESIDEGRLILRFDVFIEGLNIAKLRPELEIVHSQTAQKKERELEIATAPDKAFASYASPDRREVLGRIRSLQIFTRIDVFLDCLSIHPGESWKDRIKDEIADRDIFWLFWSRNALQSKWVDWEWRTALAAKALDYIQPHPLEGPDVAPPPAELAALQFGSLYESFLSQMRSSWWHCRITQCRRAARRVVGSYWLLAPILLLVVVVYLLWFR